jgi:predicted Ser/Thr protein kinase
MLELGRTAFSADAADKFRNAIASSTLCDFQAFHENDGQSCSQHVREQLERNVREFDSRDLNGFRDGLEGRVLSNTPDVRFIDSVYRTRDQTKHSESVKQF